MECIILLSIIVLDFSIIKYIKHRRKMNELKYLKSRGFEPSCGTCRRKDWDHCAYFCPYGVVNFNDLEKPTSCKKYDWDGTLESRYTRIKRNIDKGNFSLF